MNVINFVKSDLPGIKVFLDEYLQSLTGVVDDFWESHILTADVYEISVDNEKIGCFAVFGVERLTVFYVRACYIYLAQDIFKRILSEFNIKDAFVTTVDSLFLALCMDFHKKIELQAYFFDGERSREVRSPEYGRESLSEVNSAEIPKINVKTDNFFNYPAEAYDDPEFKVYRLSEDGVDLGYGVLYPNPLSPNYYACGMVTLPEHRKKGVGRSIQIHLADICEEKGEIPVSGCWYYNTLSKKTIESAGRHSRIRLLRVLFHEGGVR